MVTSFLAQVQYSTSLHHNLFLWSSLDTGKGILYTSDADGIVYSESLKDHLVSLCGDNFTSSFGQLRQKMHFNACRTCGAIGFPRYPIIKLWRWRCTCGTIIFPFSTNQIIDLWHCRCTCGTVIFPRSTNHIKFCGVVVVFPAVMLYFLLLGVNPAKDKNPLYRGEAVFSDA